MGKAILLLVLGSGMVLSKQLYGSQESQNRTTLAQRDYQEQLLAREIAQSAFNLGMGEVRAYGERVREGVAALNGAGGQGRAATYTNGRYAGGRYTVRAEMTSGHSIRVVATGRYGAYRTSTGATAYRATHTLHDSYRVPVLIARERSVLAVNFIDSMAGYCSAVFYQAYTPGMPEGTTPEPVMLFAPDNRDRRATRPARQIIVEPGTQMNFFIAVDQNCSERPPATLSVCEARQHLDAYRLPLADYTADGGNRGAGRFDYLHYALMARAGALDRVTESPWGMVSQHPANRQRWRLAWEDIRNLSWATSTSSNPALSLTALKTAGYDGAGWPDADATGYALLRDYGNRPDLSDQIIEVRLTPVDSPAGQAMIAQNQADRAACSLPDDTPASALPPPEAPDPAPGGGAEDAPPAAGTPGGTAPACPCSGPRKIALMHRPPGNERNEHVICVSQNAMAGHRNHNDYIVCQGG